MGERRAALVTTAKLRFIEMNSMRINRAPADQAIMVIDVEIVATLRKRRADKFDLPQGTLDLLIMRVVALGPIHGYAIAQRIQQMSREALQVQQGSLYPALHRLEYKKLLAAKWQPSETGREAKFYELTARGRTYLKDETENWKRLTDVVGLILKGTVEGIS